MRKPKNPYLEPLRATSADAKHTAKSGIVSKPLPNVGAKITNVQELNPNIFTASKMVEMVHALKSTIEAKNIELSKVKDELAFHLQVERKQEKDLKNVEFEDAPRIINNLRTELKGLKLKIKKISEEKNAQDRLLRLSSEKNAQLKETNESLRKLVEENQLEDRVALSNNLEAEKKKGSELERAMADVTRKTSLEGKNMASENKSLRIKVNDLEIHNDALAAELIIASEALKERDKLIATLNIYRYNIIHRQMDFQCRTCRDKNLKNESDKKKALTMEKIPKIKDLRLEIVSASVIRVDISVPSILCENPLYDAIKFRCFSDENLSDFSERTLERIWLEENEKMDKSVVIGSPNTDKNRKIQVSYHLDGLITGKTYTISACCVLKNLEGKDSNPVSILLDLAPVKQDIPSASLQLQSSSFYISFKPVKTLEGTHITKIDLYHKITYPAHLNHEAKVVEKIHVLDPVSNNFLLENVEQGCLHSFALSASNTMGSGPISDWTVPQFVDYPPFQPARPVIKKKSDDSVIIYFPKKINKSLGGKSHTGSPVNSFTVWFAKLERIANSDEISKGAVSKDSSPQSISVPSTNESVILDGLEPNTTYSMCISTRNEAGWSETSDPPNLVCLDALLPAPYAPLYEVVSPTAVKLILVKSEDIEKLISLSKTIFLEEKRILGLHLAKQPANSIYAIKLLMSRDASMKDSRVMAVLPIPLKKQSNLKKKTSPNGSPVNSNNGLNISANNLNTFTPGTPSGHPLAFTITVDSLQSCENYYFASCLVGTNGEDSEMSNVVWVPLASAIRLPPPTVSETELNVVMTMDSSSQLPHVRPVDLLSGGDGVYEKVKRRATTRQGSLFPPGAITSQNGDKKISSKQAKQSSTIVPVNGIGSKNNLNSVTPGRSNDELVAKDKTKPKARLNK